jgi:2-polyprenyl-6-methoxyphenol hydroxylase-like FAD-dependent oxidoreductase
VLIVGGGPVGLATALTLATAGVPVVVVEKGTWPQDKVCGEGVMPTGVDFLQRFGVLAHLPADQSWPFRGVRYREPDGVIAEADFASGPGLGIRRLALSHALAATLAHHPLVDLRPHTRLMALQQDATAVRVELTGNGSTTHVSRETFGFLVGADGRRSTVRRLAGLEAPAPGRQKRLGVRQHVALSPWSAYVEVWWQRGIEAYITPSGSQQIEVACLWDQAQFHPGARQGLDGFGAVFPELASRLQHATTRSALRGLGPLAVAASHAVAGRIILLGDALVYLDGLTGEGLSMGFAQAELVAQHLPPCCDVIHCPPERLRPLAGALQHRIASHLTMTRLALALTRHPWLRTWSMRALSRAPRMLQHCLEANMGTCRPWQIPWLAAPPLIWGLLAPRRLYRG